MLLPMARSVEETDFLNVREERLHSSEDSLSHAMARALSETDSLNV